MPQNERGWIAECLEGEYDDWDIMTQDQKQIAVMAVETKMEEDGLHTNEAIRELNHFYIKGKLLEYVQKLQVQAHETFKYTVK